MIYFSFFSSEGEALAALVLVLLLLAVLVLLLLLLATLVLLLLLAAGLVAAGLLGWSFLKSFKKPHAPQINSVNSNNELARAIKISSCTYGSSPFLQSVPIRCVPCTSCRLEQSSCSANLRRRNRAICPSNHDLTSVSMTCHS